ncbi:MAG: F0F1 ATP synthase subunit epsilon [Rhodospirillales bacterium]|nr:F0F1 ATP synthase subunit epsilon [Rhodospirillales bacterium]
MAEKVEFDLVSPERLLVSQAVDMVVVPGSEGDFGVLPRHAPMIATVRPGVIDMHENGAVAESIFVAGGFAEVTGERVTVLAEEAMAVGDITKEMAEARLKQAKEAFEEADSDQARAQAESRIAVAEAMLAVWKQLHPTGH